MKNTKIRIKIEFEDTDLTVSSSPLKLEDGTFEIVFSQDEEKIIDRSEQALMRANQPAIRDAISQYLSEYTKKKVI